MKTLIKVLHLHEADVIRGKLESNGIQAFVPDEGMESVYPVLGSTRGGIRVQVADEDFEQAKQILEDVE